MKHRHLQLAGLAVILVTAACLFGGPVMDRLFTRTETSQITASLSDGNYTTVTISEQIKGLFISGGLGWSLGSEKTSYELAFADGGSTIRWQCAGLPITLRSQGSAYYLATFDRETDMHHVDFRCYVWDGAWKELPTKLFPRSLAINNLKRFDSSTPVPFESPEFRRSLLAHFWLCIDSGRPYWEISHSMVETEFANRFRQSMKNEPVEAPKAARSITR